MRHPEHRARDPGGRGGMTFAFRAPSPKIPRIVGMTYPETPPYCAPPKVAGNLHVLRSVERGIRTGEDRTAHFRFSTAFRQFNIADTGAAAARSLASGIRNLSPSRDTEKAWLL